MRRWLLAAAGLVMCAALGCGGPGVPAQPTWANVQPIIAGECTGCHGASAAATGAGFRFDFYDMTREVCGAAADGIGVGTPLAHAYVDKIWQDISATPDQPDLRPKMPPPPAPYLADWEWKTVRAWLDDGAQKGDMPPQNRPPQFRFYRSDDVADRSLDITAIVEDPEGDPVVGTLTVGAEVLHMDHSGSFSAHLDTSSWPAGSISVTSVLCDGWSNVSYLVATLTIAHAP